MQRGGFPAKTLVLALFVVGTVYLLYLYNTTLGRLRDAELSAERYRREEETKVAQLQEVMRNKDELQERCDNEKREFTNRLTSLNQQHKMLKSQYEEHEVEQMRLEQEARRVKEEFEQVETQRNQEYQQLKQQKDLEISSLKDQLADAQRQNEVLQNQISSLRTQIQNGEQQLANKGAQLEQNQELRRQELLQQQQGVAGAQIVGGGHKINNFQQQQPQQNLGLDPNAQQQQIARQQFVQQQQQQQQQQGAGAGNADIVYPEIEDNSHVAGGQQNQGQQGGNQAGLAQGIPNQAQNQFEQQQQQQQRVEEINARHQVLPPHNNDANVVPDHPDAAVNVQMDGQQEVQHVEVNNEEHQVRPPHLNGPEEGQDKEGDAGDNREEDDDHEDPLELKQMQRPNLQDLDPHGQQLDDQQHPGVDMMHQRRNVGEEEEEEEEEDEDRYDNEEGGKRFNEIEINQEADFR